MLLRLSSLALTIVVLALVAGSTAAGVVIGRYLGARREMMRESIGAAQGALLGLRRSAPGLRPDHGRRLLRGRPGRPRPHHPLRVSMDEPPAANAPAPR